MLSLVRKLVGWMRISRGGRERWVEPSNAVTRSVLDPQAPIVPPERSLYEQVRAQYPIPERRRATAATHQSPPEPRPEPAAREEQIAAPPVEQEEKQKPGRAA